MLSFFFRIGLTLSDVSVHIANMLSKKKQTPEGTYLLVPKDIEGETVQNGTAHPPRDQKVDTIYCQLSTLCSLTKIF